MSKVKLLPCPFCGGKAKIISQNSVEDKYAIMCTNIWCIAFDIEPAYLEKFDAIKAWNTRKPMERIAERLETEKKMYDGMYEVSKWTPDKIAYANIANGIGKAIEIVKEEGGIT